MPKMPIVLLPDPVLRQVSTPIETVDDSVRRLADDMLETMYAAPGLGLAAIQVGVPRRLFVIDVDSKADERNPIVIINPELVRTSDDVRAHEEGCLSIPDVMYEIERPASVTLRYLDREGRSNELAATGLMATAIQHELDHLNGRMIIDFMSKLRRDMVIRRFRKIAREAGSA